MPRKRLTLQGYYGGEGGIRSARGSLPSVSCRFYVATNAKNTIFGRNHYTPLHAGAFGRLSSRAVPVAAQHSSLDLAITKLSLAGGVGRV